MGGEVVVECECECECEFESSRVYLLYGTYGTP